eukprot:6282247-Amphidinium_carterae.2
MQNAVVSIWDRRQSEAVPASSRASACAAEHPPLLAHLMVFWMRKRKARPAHKNKAQGTSNTVATEVAAPLPQTKSQFPKELFKYTTNPKLKPSPHAAMNVNTVRTLKL